MGKQILMSLLLIFLVFFLPWLWGGPAKEPPPELEPPPAGETVPEPPAAPEDPEPAEDRPAIDAAIPLNVMLGGKLQPMDMQTYLLGVVRAEIPVSFHEEALKAQTVAARTYILHKIAGGGSANHPQADACDDITCCQAYKSEETAAAEWGADASAAP